MIIPAFVITILGTTGIPPLGLGFPKVAEAAFQQGVNARGTPEESEFFQLAARHYETMRCRGVHNAALFRNQGNALLLSGDLPGAILAYRRGLRLNPNDRQTRTNLAYARDQVVYSSSDKFARPPADWWPPWLPRATPAFVFWFFIVSYSLTWAGLTWTWTRALESRRWPVWLGLASSCLLVAVLMIQVHYQRADIQRPLVVISQDQTYLLKGNNALYPRAYETPLNRGVEARLLQTRGSWLQIELTGGQVGWVPQDTALLDIP
jgi:hypothetical protein